MQPVLITLIILVVLCICVTLYSCIRVSSLCNRSEIRCYHPDSVTLEQAVEAYINYGMRAIINDGKIVGFTEEI